MMSKSSQALSCTLRTFSSACAFSTLLLLCVGISQASTPPNIVVVLVDDQSWNGTSVQMDPNVAGSKSDYYQTPNLEQLAAEGMRFSNGYAAAPICAPTRAALQTGMSPAQLQMTDLTNVYPGSSRYLTAYEGLPLTPPPVALFDDTLLTIPRILEQANPAYVSAMYGKWHLNSSVQANSTPLSSGYDYWEDNPFTSNPASSDPWGMFEKTALTNSFMEDRVNAGEPFFALLSHNGIHPAPRYRPETLAKYQDLPSGTVHHSPEYAAGTEDLDSSLGILMDKIDDLGIEDNTYVFYVSDHGAPTGFSRSTPLRGGKTTLLEGGLRIPFIAKGPGIAANSVSDVLVNTTDLYSTIADLAGFTGEIPENVESATIAPVLHNGGTLPDGMDHLERRFHEGGELYWHSPINTSIGANFRIRPASSVRDGDYKLLVTYGEHGVADFLSLVNLRTDISEYSNLAFSMPAKAAELKAKLDNYLSAVDASFAFDVKVDVTMDWNASNPGAENDSWRTTNDLRSKFRETWSSGGGTEQPTSQESNSFQPGLPSDSFSFDGNDTMRRTFFQVGDDGPRKNTVNVGTPDFDRSASMEFWVRLNSLSSEQILFESGDGTAGISVTLGDADSDTLANDVRLRVLGLAGADDGVSSGTLTDLTVTAKLDKYADPERDYVHVATVFSDDPNDRYGEIYINGALAARVDGLSGTDQSISWDGYDMAGLGNQGGNGIGGNGGSGDLPFSGGFQGEMAMVRFHNHPINSQTILSHYNSVLHPTDYGIHSIAGDVTIPTERPSSVSMNALESNQLFVMQERNDALDDTLFVDALISGTTLLTDPNAATSGHLDAGTAFSSYLVHFDPIGTGDGTLQSVSGAISFEGDILAILLESTSLEETDALLGSIGDYGDSLDRGLTLDLEGFLGISSDQKTLSFGLMVPEDELLQFRVITKLIREADFNADGNVDGADKGIWESAYAVDNQGDANGDGRTDGLDYIIWQQQYTGHTAPLAPVATVVPEPNTLVLCLIVLPFCSRLRSAL